MSILDREFVMIPENALACAVRHLGITRTDTVIPGRGEPYRDPTSKETHIRFMREGVEYHARFLVERVG